MATTSEESERTGTFTGTVKCPTVHYKPDPIKKMLALEWHGKQDMRLVQRARPLITDPGDAIVRITTSSICGSDLHLYHHEFQGLEAGDILGHEGVGIVEEVGPEVMNVNPGDRVVIAAVISCGSCVYCQRGDVSLCLNTNPSTKLEDMYGHKPAGIFGYTHLRGGFEGTQAEFIRVPLADNNCLKIPDSLEDGKAVLLSDLACTGWHANELGEVSEGKSVAIWGCGPVGLMTIMWAKFRGASRIIAIDGVPERLSLAKKLGAEIINFTETSNVVKEIQELIPLGPDVCIDCVGFRFSKSVLHKAQRAIGVETDTPEILTEAIKAVKKGGKVSIIGFYYNLANMFPIGAMMEKGLTVRGGLVFVQKYWKQLMEYFVTQQVDPSCLITHQFPFDKAEEAYKIFDTKEDGVVKVLLKTSTERK